MSLTKKDLAEKINRELHYTMQDSLGLLEDLISVLKSTLKSGENVKIAGFGNFEVKHKKERAGRNPHSGAPLTLASRKVVSFKVSTLLRDRINGKTK